MQLTAEQQHILDGGKGEAFARIMKTLVMYGETFGAERMVPVTGKMGHLVTSFGLSVMKPLYGLMNELIEAGALSRQPFSVDPRPLDKNVPANPLQNLFFKVMYSKQRDYDAQLRKLGIAKDNAYSCTCYMDEVGNIPQKGDVLSWAESSAVVYANSVLGARCNRNSGILELFGSILGWAPCFGLLTDEGRKATWVVQLKTTKQPEAQVLGSAIGMRVMEDVPYIKGLDAWIGTELTQDARDYLKDMGAASASNGAVGLYHVENLTPEARELGDALITQDARVYVIDDEELMRVKAGYPCIWKSETAAPKLCFVGCPHLSLRQLHTWTERLLKALQNVGRQKVAIPTVFTAAPGVLEAFEKTDDFAKLKNAGVVTSYICPLMYMNNPLCGKMPVITNSNKLRTYTSARYYESDEILQRICGEVRQV
ncbi:MAG: aconitase X catalytic domain-containing protein [Clostridiales bacterium]|jgi:predicted aconitase|nr:aconitase X catalytic domain-containing protein [Clostridiales bacterium]